MQFRLFLSFSIFLLKFENLNNRVKFLTAIFVFCSVVGMASGQRLD